MINLSNIKSLVDLVNFGEVIGDLMDDDIAVSISDTEKILKYYPGRNLILPISDGMILPNGSALKSSMVKNKSINDIIPKSVYGISFRSICNPIINEKGKVIGGISVARSLEIQSELIESAENLTSSLIEISESVTDVANNAQMLAESHYKVMDSVKEANNAMKETDEVLNFIKEISSQTNLLGLNAAIEAARAGENGKGFGVVAEEIRKLSKNSSEAVKGVHDILQKIVKSVDKISREIKDTSEATEEQAAATEQINASIEELNSISEMMVHIGKKL
jgi:hypothetical protein